MESHVAKVVPLQELREYFGSKNWRLEPDDESGKPGLNSHSKYFNHGEEFDVGVKILQSDVAFKINIEAIDDPTISEEITTDKPAEDIIKYLSRGVPGGEEIFKQGFSPNQMARALCLIASAIQGKSLKKRANLIKLLKRIVISSHSYMFHKIMTFFRIAVTDQERQDTEAWELSNLKNELKRHNWTISEHKSEIGKPQLEVNVQDLFELTISVDSIEYEYYFELEGFPKSVQKGKSEDPIKEFRNWHRSDEFQEASSARTTGPGDTEVEDTSSARTTRPGDTEVEVEGIGQAPTVPARTEP